MKTYCSRGYLPTFIMNRSYYYTNALPWDHFPTRDTASLTVLCKYVASAIETITYDVIYTLAVIACTAVTIGYIVLSFQEKTTSFNERRNMQLHTR